MAIIPYLAMTAAEYESTDSLPPRMAWMACHFSPYATGLSNLPSHLPEDSMIIVNDITPIHKHKPEMIAEQLIKCIEDNHCCAVLLDFQRGETDTICELTQHLLDVLPCPAAVSNTIAARFQCPVFLPPCPLHEPLGEYIGKWSNREIWLDAALEAETIVLTEKGADYSFCEISSITPDQCQKAYKESDLHCHYTIETSQNKVTFTLWRNSDDIQDLIQEAEQCGISKIVGLYQELRHNNAVF